MPKIDIASVEGRNRPPAIRSPIATRCAGRERQRLGNAVGLDQFGVNLSPVEAGRAVLPAPLARRTRTSSSTSSRATLVLCEDDGETVLRPGDAAGWKAGVANGHCLVNRSGADAVFLEIGTRATREQARISGHRPARSRKDERGFRYHAQVRRTISEAE